ncbi:MAG: hypothetical protein SF182_12415 [Deltaproteobacteria bacterium]|nr:hypothetical protein [Deltaproteobacteria bacterium]
MIDLDAIHIGDQAYLEEGGEEFGAVRALDPTQQAVIVYVENRGELSMPLRAVRSAHDGKVVFDGSLLPSSVRAAIRHAHDREEPGS